MPSIGINSANIGTFQFTVTFDLYNRRVLFNTSGTTYNGAGASNILGIYFSLVDQSGVTLASINIGTPQISPPVTSGNWIYTLDLSSVDFAFLFQSYSIIGAIQDSNGTLYQTPPIIATVCQPQNITDSGYVPGMFQVIPDCINNVLTVKEITLLVYNNLQPQTVTKTGVLNYPIGTISYLSFSNTPFSNNVVYTGQYSIQCTTVGTYALGNDVYVLVSYITNNNVFPVTCQNKISDLMCCIQQVQATAIRHCEDELGYNAKNQLNDILPYVVTGIGKEISGQDAFFEADYIRKYLNCNCGSASQSQSEFTPINPAVNSIVLNGVGGTSIPSPTITGNTKTYNIASNVYQVVKGNTGDLAFTITTNTSISNTVQYLLTINYDTFAGSILTAIAADPTLINELNNLVNSEGFNPTGLNGLCIINLNQKNYSLSINVTSGTIITNIVINGTTYNAPTNLFANTPTPINTWLNSLTLGTFNATVTTGILTILSVNNTNTVSTMTFTTPNVTIQFQASTATLDQVLQAIFNYICGMTALQVALGANLSLCSFDYNGNQVTTNYASSSNQAGYNAGISSTICNIVARMASLTGITCSTLQDIFSTNPNASFNNGSDWYMSVVGGTCTQLNGRQQALAFIAAVNAYTDVKNAFCGISCTSPVTCPDISGINISTVGGNIAIYGVTFSTTPTANQIVAVYYRVHGNPTYILSTSNLNLFPNGNINGTSPYQISGLSSGTQYDVFIQNGCGGLGFTTQITTPSNTAFSGSFLLDNIIYNICGDSTVILYSSSPFAPGVTMYTNIGLTSAVTGYLFIAPNTGAIYNLNNVTGVVGTSTGNACNTGVSGSYILGNNSGTVCSGSPVTLYTNGGFTVGGIIYTDSSLTNPVIGFSYVVNKSNGHIYNLNNANGTIGTDTGLVCAGNSYITETGTTGNSCQRTYSFKITGAPSEVVNFNVFFNHDTEGQNGNYNVTLDGTGNANLTAFPAPYTLGSGHYEVATGNEYLQIVITNSTNPNNSIIVNFSWSGCPI